jgi:hypothetical protein
VSRPRSGRARLVTGVLSWLAAVAGATAVGIAAVSAIGSGIVGAGPQPLTQSEVDARLAVTRSSSPTSPGAPPTSASPTTARDNSQVFAVQGGTIIARCVPGGVEVVSATPAQGYQVSADREIDDHPSVTFTSGRTEVEIRLRCRGESPEPEVKIKD